jgi:hypothetical protein
MRCKIPNPLDPYTCPRATVAGMYTNKPPLTPQQEYDEAERWFFDRWRISCALTVEDVARPDREDLRKLYEARDADPELRRLKERAERHYP